MNYVKKEHVRRYMKSLPRLQTRKTNRGGLIGICQSGSSWIAVFPNYLGKSHVRTKTALAAAVEYNARMLKWFGEKAVLCDVHAAMAADIMEVQRNR